MATIARPHKTYRSWSILLGEFVQFMAKTLGVLQNILVDAVAHNERQVLIRNNKGDIVMRTDNMRDKRIDKIITERLATYALHSRHPQIHIVLLLLAQDVGKFISID